MISTCGQVSRFIDGPKNPFSDIFIFCLSEMDRIREKKDFNPSWPFKIGWTVVSTCGQVSRFIDDLKKPFSYIFIFYLSEMGRIPILLDHLKSGGLSVHSAVRFHVRHPCQRVKNTSFCLCIQHLSAITPSSPDANFVTSFRYSPLFCWPCIHIFMCDFKDVLRQKLQICQASFKFKF